MQNDILVKEINKLVVELKERGFTIATAESCTGGLVASTIVSVSGSSDVFHEGYVTYSNEAKMKNLGVKKETLDRYGAVSEFTAREMAEGVRRVSGADIGVATTGIAGPTGGTEDKPVGLVYIAVSINDKTVVRELRLHGERNENRNKTVEEVLSFVMSELSDIQNE